MDKVKAFFTVDGLKDFFTVKNSLIVVICILSLVLIVQNVHRYGGRRHPGDFGGSRATSSRGISGFPGMGGGMMGGGAYNRRPGN